MSFGIRDEDWVNPDDETEIKCRDCNYYKACPCGCGQGWCIRFDWYTDEEDGCA